MHNSFFIFFVWHSFEQRKLKSQRWFSVVWFDNFQDNKVIFVQHFSCLEIFCKHPSLVHGLWSNHVNYASHMVVIVGSYFVDRDSFSPNATFKVRITLWERFQWISGHLSRGSYESFFRSNMWFLKDVCNRVRFTEI
jgi:hypothetical protein